MEPDHLDHWKTFDKIEAAFVEFCELTKERNGFAVICADDEGGRNLISKAKEKGVKVISYGTNSDSELKITNLKLGLPGPSFDVNFEGKNLGRIELKVLGLHNALNAAAALCVGLGLGKDFKNLKMEFLNSQALEEDLNLEAVQMAYAFMTTTHIIQLRLLRLLKLLEMLLKVERLWLLFKHITITAPLCLIKNLAKHLV